MNTMGDKYHIERAATLSLPLLQICFHKKSQMFLIIDHHDICHCKYVLVSVGALIILITCKFGHKFLGLLVIIA